MCTRAREIPRLLRVGSASKVPLFGLVKGKATEVDLYQVLRFHSREALVCLCVISLDSTEALHSLLQAASPDLELHHSSSTTLLTPALTPDISHANSHQPHLLSTIATMPMLLPTNYHEESDEPVAASRNSIANKFWDAIKGIISTQHETTHSNTESATASKSHPLPLSDDDDATEQAEHDPSRMEETSKASPNSGTDPPSTQNPGWPNASPVTGGTTGDTLSSMDSLAASSNLHEPVEFTIHVFGPSTSPIPSSSTISSSNSSTSTIESQNDTNRYAIDGQTVQVIIARTCGHHIHPCNAPGTYTHELCPFCRLHDLVDSLKHYLQKLSKLSSRGVVEWARYCRSLKFENGESEPLNKFHTIVNGKFAERKGVRKKGGVGRKNRRRGGWRTAKKRLVNFVDWLRDEAVHEVEWEAENFRTVGEIGGHEALITYSAKEALRVYGELEETLCIAGDPATRGAKNDEEETKQQRKEAISTSSSKRKRDAEEETEVEENQRPTKRRITFNEDVYVSLTHDIDDPNTFSARLKSRDIPPPASSALKSTISESAHFTDILKSPASPNYRKPKSAHTMTWLCECPSRINTYYDHTPSNKWYSPGPWFSPEGYKKANTSWYHESWEDMELDANGAIAGTGAENKDGEFKVVDEEQSKDIDRPIEDKRCGADPGGIGCESGDVFVQDIEEGVGDVVSCFVVSPAILPPFIPMFEARKRLMVPL